MSRYTIKVPNGDEGEDLGVYEGCLPCVGDPIVLLHPRVNPRQHEPFVGKVALVTHDAYYGGEKEEGHVDTTVWVEDEAPAPQLYCDCAEEDRSRHGVDEDGDCENCRHRRRTL